MRGPSDPKRLKPIQADKLRRIASDGRRRSADRQWAMRMLTDAGEELATKPSKSKRTAKLASKTTVPK